MQLNRSKLAILVAAALAAAGCGILQKPKRGTPVLGQRISVLTSEVDVAVDPATAALPLTLPPAAANAEWAQSGGNAAKSMGQLALGNALTRVWSASIGRGTSFTARLAA
ncbi:MAG: pyrrolo-quinoline quinone, partial [Sphingomonas sp.]|nr:pyrrolo-quinoline quinone [Sphingomonas sp.]